MVLVKEMVFPAAALDVVEITESAVSTTGPVNVCVPLLAIFPPILIAEELVKLSTPIGVVSPIVDPKVIGPEPLVIVKF
jgi:hypothetical protein